MSTVMFVSGGKDSVLAYLLAKEKGIKIDMFACRTYNGKVVNPTPLGAADCTETPDPSWVCLDCDLATETGGQWQARFLDMYPDIDTAIVGNDKAEPMYYRSARDNGVKMISPVFGMTAMDVVKELTKRGIEMEFATGPNKGQKITEAFLNEHNITDFSKPKVHSKVTTPIIWQM